MDQTPLSFEQYAAERLLQDRQEITRTWVKRLSAQLDIHPIRVLPHETLLDDIPVVLAKAAEFLLTPDTDKLTAEQFVADEMMNIASLRRRQGYEVREIIREFDELAHILDLAALTWVDDYPGSPDPRSVGRVFGRLNRVPLLMGQVTVGVVEAERNELLRRLASAEEQERLRISRELHDQMGQLVTALQVGLKGLPRDGAAPERIAELEQLADRVSREIHRLAVEMRPPGLDNLGLALALESMLHEWSDRNGVECDFQAVNIGVRRFPAEVETTLYRVAQEGLTNVLKHACASRVSVLLEQRGGAITLVIEDDGQGFDTDLLYSPQKAQTLGLRGMRERVAPLGGRLDVESSPGIGTTLFVRVSDGPPPLETDTPG